MPSAFQFTEAVIGTLFERQVNNASLVVASTDQTVDSNNLLQRYFQGREVDYYQQKIQTDMTQTWDSNLYSWRLMKNENK